MIRNLKALGLAAFAAMALGAMFASAASAQNPGILTAGTTEGNHHTPTLVHAVQYGAITDNAFHAFDKTLHCEDNATTFTGEASGTDEELTIDPNYKDCYAVNAEHKPELAVTVTDNDCHFTFGPVHSDEGSHTTWTGTVDVFCPPGKSIEIEAYTATGANPLTSTHGTLLLCKQTVGAQNGLGVVTYHNIAGKPDDITVTIDVQNIKATQEGLCGAKETNAARYTGTLTLTSGTPSTKGTDDLWFSTKK